MSEQLLISESLLDTMSAISEYCAAEMIAEIDYYIVNGKMREQSPEDILRSHLKYARGVDNSICFVHNESMTAYKTGGYETAYKLIEPLEVDGTFVFERWCTMMDM